MDDSGGRDGSGLAVFLASVMIASAKPAGDTYRYIPTNSHWRTSARETIGVAYSAATA